MVGADPDLGVTHHDLDVQLGAAVAHHDLVAGPAVAAGPADLAELGLALDRHVRVVGRVIDSEPDSARIRLRPVVMAPLIVA